MRSVQKSKQAIHSKYMKAREAFLQLNDLCQANVPGVCQHWSSDIHHIAGRVGKMLTDDRYFMAVCRSCHDWIHTHVTKAREKGWIIYNY